MHSTTQRNAAVAAACLRNPVVEHMRSVEAERDAHREEAVLNVCGHELTAADGDGRVPGGGLEDLKEGKKLLDAIQGYIRRTADAMLHGGCQAAYVLRQGSAEHFPLREVALRALSGGCCACLLSGLHHWLVQG